MNTIYQFLPLLLLVFIMYFLLIRPQKRKEKQINAMRSSVKAGDDIVTIGGIYGKVTRVRDDVLTIQVGADKTKFEITRWAVSKIEESSTASSRTVKSRPSAAQDEDGEPAVKKPRRRLERAPKTDAPVDPVEPNPLETDADNTPLE